MTTTFAAPSRRRDRVAEGSGLRGRALATLQAAVVLALESASDATLEAIIVARDDPAQALAVAPRDIAPAPPERLAAERAAKARTAHFRAELAGKAGGMFARADVAELLGVTPAAVDKQRQRNQVLGVPYGTEIRYPAGQFKDGAVLSGLKPILAAFGDMNSWGQLQLLVAPLDGFDDGPASILDLLDRGVGENTRTQLVSLVHGWV